MLKTKTWSEFLKQRYTAKEIAAINAAARRMILVEYYRADEGSWVVFVRRGRGKDLQSSGRTIAAARRRARAALVAAVGDARAKELWRTRAETMPAGAEDEEVPRRRSAKTERPRA